MPSHICDEAFIQKTGKTVFETANKIKFFHTVDGIVNYCALMKTVNC